MKKKIVRIKFDLQQFAEATPGKRIIYKYRLAADAAKEDAWALSFVTENGNDVTVDADSTATKDGTIRTPSTPEIEISSTSILPKGDEKSEKIRNGMLNNELFEVWEINLDRPGNAEGKYKGTYYQGYFTEHNLTSDADDMAQLELTFGANGKGVDGECTVTTAELAEASYVFKDTTKTSTGA